MLIPCEYSAIPAAEYGHLHGVRLSVCWSSAIPAAEYTKVSGCSPVFGQRDQFFTWYVRRTLALATRSDPDLRCASGGPCVEMMVLGLGRPPGHENVYPSQGVVGKFGVILDWIGRLRTYSKWRLKEKSSNKRLQTSHAIANPSLLPVVVQALQQDEAQRRSTATPGAAVLVRIWGRISNYHHNDNVGGASTPWEQILPLLFVFGFAPLLALGTYYKYNARRTLPWLAAMFLENLGLGFAWSWLYDHDSPASSSRERERKPARKKHHLRRADHAAARAENTHEGENELYYYYPGVVNISGTYCFLNSTLQAMASLCYLQPYLDAVHSRAVRLDVPTPVVDALRDALSDLNTPTPRPRVLRPVSVINALSGPVPGKQRSALFASREHQDAQELFQLVSEAVKNEARAVDDELSRDRGLGELSRAPSEELDSGVSMTMTSVGRDKDAAAAVAKGVFDGLTANRRSCVECGYTEAVMHFAFDNWQLAVPRMASCRLEDCLTDYTRLELLNDCICRKCSMLTTHKRLVAEAEKATEAASASGSMESARPRRSVRGKHGSSRRASKLPWTTDGSKRISKG
ncbi:hypothetical protein JB92DRAFT_3093501 [Gautieria morchelliformis]|nr:hypothetical protein JB92DRAFT_3093501 [Gautieria morchelliformis]